MIVVTHHQTSLPTGPQCEAAAVPDPDPAICPVLNVTFPGTNETTAYAAFGQVTYSVTDRLRLTLGTRYSHEEKDFASDFLSDGVSPAWRIYHRIGELERLDA